MGYVATSRGQGDSEGEDHDEQKRHEESGGPARLPLLLTGAQVCLVTHHVPLKGTAASKA
jgi:hypothetical protein